MANTVKTPIGNAPIIPVALIITGLYLMWFAVHYWGSDTKWPSDPVKGILQGKGIPLASGQETAADVALAESAQSETSGQQGTGSLTGSSIADDALKYVGAGYVWGGPANRVGNWDCSSFVSYVLGHDLGEPLPGGSFGQAGFPPNAHGPTTLQYMLYGAPVNYGSEQPGDLLVSSEHMGIVIGNGQMVSAEDPQSGTGIAGYQSGFPGGQPLVRRVGGTVGGKVVSANGQIGGGGGHT